MRFIIPVFLLFCVSSQASIDPAGLKLPLPEIEKLSNGLTIAWFLDDKLPVVDLALRVQSGTRSDPEGKSGAAEMTARMLERGANGMSAFEFARRVEALGASGYADADEESVSIGMHGLSQDASTLLGFVAGIARAPAFLPEEFRREKKILEESWRHLADSAQSVSGYVFGKTVLNGTPYGRGSLDRLSSLEKLKLNDIVSFHRSTFVPKNSILVVIGRVDRVSFRKKIQNLFGDWKGSLPKESKLLFRDERFAFRRGEILITDLPDLPQAQIRVGFPVPGIRSEKRHALAVANALLGEYFNSRLNLIVRDRLGLAYGIESSLTYFKDAAFFSIASATANPNVGKLLEETLHQLRLLKAADILAEEVEVSKDYLIGGFPLRVATLSSIANRWLSGYSFQLGPNFLNEFMPKISAVGREAVVQAIDEAFQLDRLVVVVAGDAKQIEKSLKEKGFKRFRRVPVKTLL